MLESMGVEDASFIAPEPLDEAGFAFPLVGEIVFTFLPELESAPFVESSLELPRSLLVSSARFWTALEVKGLGSMIVF